MVTERLKASRRDLRNPADGGPATLWCRLDGLPTSSGRKSAGEGGPLRCALEPRWSGAAPLPELPALGRLEAVERAMGLMAGYGLFSAGRFCRT